MAKLSSDIMDATLLCERCGYVLEGLDEGGACPECGQRIAESLPSRRTGTPFQVSPGWRGFVKQCGMLARRPTEMFGRMRVTDSPALTIADDSFSIAAVIAIIPLAWRAWNEIRPTVSLLAVFVAVWLLLLVWYCIRQAMVLLTWIERVGVVFFARKREWRIPKPVAQAICANATPGWIPASVLLNVGVGLMMLIWHVIYDLPLSWQPWAETAAAAMPVLGFIAGMLVFETLVYIGVRRSKYANWVQRPARGDEPAPASQAEEAQAG